MPDQPVTFTSEAAARIVAAVRAVEAEGTDLTGEIARKGHRDYPDVVVGKITGSTGTGESTKYSWSEVKRKHDGTWEVLTGGRTGTTTDRYAFEFKHSGSVATNDVVALVRANVKQADGSWVTAWAVVPTAKLFPVKVTVYLGSAGSPTTTCSWTYTVKSLAGTTLSTGISPKRPRYANCEYRQPAADSPGLAYYDTAGTLQLYEVVEEIPKGDTVTYITQLQVSGNYLQQKTRTALVLELDAESAWTTWHTGTTCS